MKSNDVIVFICTHVDMVKIQAALSICKPRQKSHGGASELPLMIRVFSKTSPLGWEFTEHFSGFLHLILTTVRLALLQTFR